MKKIFIGVDVSKLKLDFCNFQDGMYCNETVIPNHAHAIRKQLQDIMNENTTGELLVCAEYTGQYIYPLCCVCNDLGIDLWLENPVQIKYRSGMQRGKNDKLDARKIATYANRFEDQAHLFSLPEKSIQALKHLVSERDMLVCDKAKYKGQLTDQKDFMDSQLYQNKNKRLSRLIRSLNEAIKQIEDEIQSIIDNYITLSRQHQFCVRLMGLENELQLK